MRQNLWKSQINFANRQEEAILYQFRDCFKIKSDKGETYSEFSQIRGQISPEEIEKTNEKNLFKKLSKIG